MSLAEKLELQVRLEALDEGQPGGLCRIGRRWLVLIDERAEILRQGDALLAALAEYQRQNPQAAEMLDDLYILPELRQELEDLPPEN